MPENHQEEHQEKFSEYVLNGDLEQVKEIIQTTEISAYKLGESLINAADKGYIKMVEFLLQESRKRIGGKITEAEIDNFQLGKALEKVCCKKGGCAELVGILLLESRIRFELKKEKQKTADPIAPVRMGLCLDEACKNKNKEIAVKILVYQALLNYKESTEFGSDKLKEGIINDFNESFKNTSNRKSDQNPASDLIKETDLSEKDDKKLSEKDITRQEGLLTTIEYPDVIGQMIVGYVGNLENEQPELLINEEILKQQKEVKEFLSNKEQKIFQPDSSTLTSSSSSHDSPLEAPIDKPSSAIKHTDIQRITSKTEKQISK